LALPTCDDVGRGLAVKRILLMAVASLALGLSSFAMQHSAARPIELDAAISEFAVLPLRFQVLETPRESQNIPGTSVAIKVFEIENTVAGAEIKPLAARGLLRGADDVGQLESQAVYSCQMEIRAAPRDGRAGFLGNCQTDLVKLADPPAINFAVKQIRDSFMKNLRGVDEDASGLVAGLAIGDVSRISDELASNMRTVSLTHLTAVSGANCAIVLAMVYLLVRQFGGGRGTRLFFGLTALAGYVLLVGPQPSVLRAAVMAAAVLIGISAGRRTGALNGLAISIIVLLIADPWLATDFGFGLSVAATLGLLVLTAPLIEIFSRSLPKWLAVGLAVSVSAQVFCLPILLQLQSGLATYSLPANLLAESLVAPITVLGVTACVIAWFMPWVATLLTYVASVFSWVICQIAKQFSDLPNPVLGWPTGIPGAVIAVSLILSALLWLRAEPIKLRNLGLLGILIIVASSFGAIGFSTIKSANWPLKNWAIVACDVGQGDAVVVRSAGQIALIDVGREDQAVDSCLRKLKITTIDLLVLTHFDLDHVGGLSGAIAGREVKLTLTSPFEDERWSATGTYKLLADKGVPIALAEKGMSGTLGEISWSVLSPERAAAGTEDSNDASIAMIWHAKTFNLLTMADTGERAQMRMARELSWVNKISSSQTPLILKVAHHGSADQFPELVEAVDPEVSILSAGKGNSYGHPTGRTLDLLKSTGSTILRTDYLGSVAIANGSEGLVMANSPRG